MNQEAECSTSGVTPFRDSLEKMADMDELFGSDGDSDNDQRGNDHFISYNNAYRVSGCLIPGADQFWLVFTDVSTCISGNSGLWFLFAISRVILYGWCHV